MLQQLQIKQNVIINIDTNTNQLNVTATANKTESNY